MSSKNDPDLPAVNVYAHEGRKHLTNKTFSALSYIYKNHLEEADWFLKADDDTYVIMENLRHFLSTKDPTRAGYYGQVFRSIYKNKVYTYNSGGAGYVLSKRSLEMFSQLAPSSPGCRSVWGVEDMELGACLASIGIHPGHTLDDQGRTMFHALEPSDVTLHNLPDWYYHINIFENQTVSVHVGKCTQKKIGLWGLFKKTCGLLKIQMGF